MTSPEQLGLSPECETVKLATEIYTTRQKIECSTVERIRDPEWRDFCRRHLDVCTTCQEYDATSH